MSRSDSGTAVVGDTESAALMATVSISVGTFLWLDSRRKMDAAGAAAVYAVKQRCAAIAAMRYGVAPSMRKG